MRGPSGRRSFQISVLPRGPAVRRAEDVPGWRIMRCMVSAVWILVNPVNRLACRDTSPGVQWRDVNLPIGQGDSLVVLTCARHYIGTTAPD
jgi:hypothetical protein